MLVKTQFSKVRIPLQRGSDIEMS